MQLSELWAEAGRLLSDADNGRWGTDILTIRANLAQREVQGYTNAVKTQETITPVANTRAVSVNANTMDILRATKTLGDGITILPFTGIDQDALDVQYPTWRQWQNGEPRFWYYDATLQTINLAPIPDASNAITNGITLWESRQPTDLVNSTDIPFDSNNQMVPYHMSIVHWIVAQCWMDDGTPESLAKARYHKSGDIGHPGQYELQLKRIMEKFDVSEAIQSRILWVPQGARVGTYATPSKGYPLA